MKRFFSLFLLCFLLLTCSDSNQTNNIVQSLPDTIGRKAKSIPDSKSTDNWKSSKILGAWTNHQTENATFDIQKDAIFYVDALESYSYRLDGNKITIQFPEYKYEAVLSWLGDTLVMTDKDNGATKFTRFTE
jgi:hypothetical protein